MLPIATSINTASLIGFLSGLVAPLIVYITATRRLSGKISTSEASELWKSSIT